MRVVVWPNQSIISFTFLPSFNKVALSRCLSYLTLESHAGCARATMCVYVCHDYSITYILFVVISLHVSNAGTVMLD